MPDQSELPEPIEPTPQRTNRGAAIVVAVLLIYVMSPIPVAWMLEKSGIGDRVEPAFAVFYAPLGFFADRFEIVDSFYEWQSNLFDR